LLALRRGVVLAASGEGEQQLTVDLADGGVHPAIADSGLVGRCDIGDEVIVNVAARELGLGSGGFDVVHVNITRGLAGAGIAGAHVMKLNYTSLQHAVHPVEASSPAPPAAAALGAGEEAADADVRLDADTPVAVIALHSQLAPLAWAFGETSGGGARLGYVQTAGGALPGSHSRSVRELRERGLLAAHITAGGAFGGADGEAISTAGALHHGLRELGWDAAVCGPGPGIIGSGSALGHGGLVALDSAHTALALGAATVLIPRMSAGDPRPAHRALSHHSRTVLELALAPLIVALPAGEPVPEGERARRHDWRAHAFDLDGYTASGLPASVMGRSVVDDPLFFAAALAGGGVLAELVGALRAP
jgi:hypothetical protein